MRNSKVGWGILVVLVVAMIGASLALQGWRSRIPAFDLLLSTDGAHELLVHKRIPDRGALSSYVSHNPAGGAWLMLPGVFLFSDPRLFEYIGSVILYVGTLVGVFLLARSYFGMRSAILSVLLYGLSELGLYVASSLWERFPLHFFYVWMVYLAAQWVRHRQITYLAAAIITWILGMYVFMEIAPAFFILPALWLIYRPPLTLKPLMFVGLLAVVVWYPYLRFQFTRNFADLRSQVLRHRLLPANHKDSWCNPRLKLLNVDNSSGAEDSNGGRPPNVTGNVWSKISERGELILIGLLSNFDHAAQVSGNSVFLLLLVIISFLGLGVTELFRLRMIEYPYWGYWLARFGIGMIVFGILANEPLIARYLSPDGILKPPTVSKIRWLQALLVISGLSLLVLRRRIVSTVTWLAMRMQASDQIARHRENARLLVLSLLIPWVILLLMVTPNRTERYWWLWPLQAILLAAATTYLPARLRAPRLLAGVGSLLVLLSVLANPFLLSRTNAWLREGWSASDAGTIAVIDFMADQIKSQGKDQAAIGYDIYMKPFNAIFNIADRRYKVGAQLDRLFKYRHGIMNTDDCAEGISPDDQYRIVQTSSRTVNRELRRVDVPADARFKLLRNFEFYQVFQRH